MKTTKMSTIVVLALGLMVWSVEVSEAAPMGTAFTYQGRLIDANSAADGEYDFEFKLFDDANTVTGNQLGSTIDINDLDVIDGQFAIELDFGSDPNIFNGDARWLEIGVRPGDSNDPNTFVTLSPRQELTPIPYAIYAKRSKAADDADKLDGFDSSAFAAAAHSHGGVYALISHTHSGSDITTGTVADARIAETIARDSELTWGNLANIPTGFADGVDNDSGGDITAVNAGTGLSGGGTSGNVTLNVDVPLSLSGSSSGGIIRGTNSYSSGRGVYGYASKSTGSYTNYGGYFGAAGAYGRGVYGEATYSAAATNYGGYFMAAGKYGRGVYGEATGSDGRGVVGLATSTEDETHYGGYFEAYGEEGVGIYAKGNDWAGSFQGRVRIYGSTSIHGSTFIYGNLHIKSASSPYATVLSLGEGLDYAEGFDVSDESEISGGTVLVIDSENPGKLAISDKPYDSKVAGIVAGAKGQGSGVRLGSDEFDYDVALAGRVYCNVDAAQAGVEPGDLLTTSATPGYAMKAADYMRAQGAILGKAMEKLEKGKKGQILVLVTLQ